MVNQIAKVGCAILYRYSVVQRHGYCFFRFGAPGGCPPEMRIRLFQYARLLLRHQLASAPFNGFNEWVTMDDQPTAKSARKDAPRTIKRVAVVAPDAATLLPLRGPLLRAIAARRHRILCIAPEFSAPVLNELADIGIECAEYPVEASRLTIGAQMKILGELTARFKQWRPHVVLGYGALPALFAPIAAKQAKIERIIAMFTGLDGIIAQDLTNTTDLATATGTATVTGTATATVRQSRKKKRQHHNSLSRSLRVQRWRALRSCDQLIFHNNEDLRQLERLDLLPAKLPVHVVRGSGVDLDHFSQTPLPTIDDGLTFVMIAQLRQAKGVLDFCAAAARVQAEAPTAKFILVGPSADEAAGGVPIAELTPFTDIVEFIGPVDDVRPYLQSAHVFVLPSRYGEGMSKTLGEALAIGRPVITCDLAGCREMVDERVNGCLIEPGDTDGLADAIQSFLRRPDLIPAMARASRAKAERWFDVKDVNRQMLDILAID